MKRIIRFFTASVLVVLFCINVNTLAADENPIDAPWRIDYPAVGRLVDCVEQLGGRWTRGSVEWLCTEQWVCPNCYCTPEACGKVSVGH